MEHARYWGDFSDVDTYINFLQLYATEDTFTLAGGELNYFYQNPQPDFFTFYCELMDRFAQREGTPYWTTKLDPLFTLYPEAWSQFEQLLARRYGQRPRFVAIRRKVKDCLLSYLFMEGRNFNRRQQKIGQTAAVALGTARYYAQYNWIDKVVQKHEGIELRFEQVVTNPNPNPNEYGLATYLSLDSVLSRARESIYRKNTSFKGRPNSAGSEPKVSRKVGSLNAKFLERSITFFSTRPRLAHRVYAAYNNQSQRLGTRTPLYRKLLKARYFQDALRDDLERANALNLTEESE